MNDLISRQKLLAAYDREHTGTPGRARKLIENAPAVDARPVIHAHWIDNEKIHGNDENYYGTFWPTCSNCGSFPLEGGDENPVYSKYCPSCGALMDGKDENHEEKS